MSRFENLLLRWVPWGLLLMCSAMMVFSCRAAHGQVNPLTSQNIYVKGALTKTETQTNTGFGIILNATGGTGGGGGSSYGANAPLSLSGTNFGLVTATSAGFALTNGSLTIVSATLATNIGLGTAAYTASGTFAPAFGTTGGITLNGTNLTTIVGPGLINTAGTLAIDPQYATYQSSRGNWYFGLSGNTTGTGLQNFGMGSNALQAVTTGGSNSAVGYLAGYNAGTPLQTITKCTFLGTAANASADALTNSMALGYNAQVTASNQAVIGNTSVTTATIGAASAAGVNLTGTGGYTFGNGAAAANQSPVMNYVYTAAVSGGTATVDLAQGNIETVALTSSVTTINVINTPAAGKRMTIVFYQPSGGVQPAVWSGTTILWSNGTTGTFTAATGKHDIMSVLYDGTNCYAIMSSNY